MGPPLWFFVGVVGLREHDRRTQAERLIRRDPHVLGRTTGRSLLGVGDVPVVDGLDEVTEPHDDLVPDGAGVRGIGIPSPRVPYPQLNGSVLGVGRQVADERLDPCILLGQVDLEDLIFRQVGVDERLLHVEGLLLHVRVHVDLPDELPVVFVRNKGYLHGFVVVVPITARVRIRGLRGMEVPLCKTP